MSYFQLLRDRQGRSASPREEPRAARIESSFILNPSLFREPEKPPRLRLVPDMPRDEPLAIPDDDDLLLPWVS